MIIKFFPKDEVQFKKDAVDNFVYTEVTNLTTKEIITFSRKVTTLWTASCKNNILTDHRIRALTGSNYSIENWIEPYDYISNHSIDDSQINYWIVSSNPSLYDSISGFQNYSEIDWGNVSNNKINVGDIVYIYITKPLQKIRIKTVVVKNNYGKDELLSEEGQFNQEDHEGTCENFIRLKLMHFIESDFLGMHNLSQNGINGNIQGKRRVEGETLSYIQYHENDGNSPEYSIETLTKELEKGIQLSKFSSAKDREERLIKANKKPEQIEIKSRGFKRNPDVVLTVLNRANGICEKCEQKAPFIRKKDQTPYLEVHHKKQLAHGGEDSVENAIAVCPNCHRELHFGV